MAKLCAEWLKRGSYIAIIGSDGILSGQQPWQRLVAATIREWTGDAFPQGWATSGPTARTGIANDEQVLRSAGFVDVTSYTFVEPYVWTVENIIGYLRSTSVASVRILGDNVLACDAALKAALLTHDPSGRYDDQLRFGYTLGRMPG